MGYLVTRRKVHIKKMVESIDKSNYVGIQRNSQFDLLLLQKPGKIIKRRVTTISANPTILKPILKDHNMRKNFRSKSVNFDRNTKAQSPEVAQTGNAKSNMAKDGTPCDSPDLNTGSTTKSVSEMSSSVERTGDGMIDNDSESIGPTGNAQSKMAVDATPSDIPDLNTGSYTESVSKMNSSVQSFADGVISTNSGSISQTDHTQSNMAVDGAINGTSTSNDELSGFYSYLNNHLNNFNINNFDI